MTREARALAAVDDQETLTLLRELIRCPSENPPGNEEATAACLAAYFERHGIAHRLVEIAPGRPNLIAELGAPDGPVLVLNGHTDTVPVGGGWTVDPFSAEVRDGQITGRGACDMLAGVAAMSATIVALKTSEVALAGRIEVHAVIDEEVGSLGSRRAAQDVEADWVIVTEASAGQVQTYGKGQLNLEVVFHGRAVHSSTPERGRNAIHDAAAFVSALERASQRRSGLSCPGVGPVTYAATIIDGGSSGSIIPDACAVTVDRRVLPTETLDQAKADVLTVLEQVRSARPGLEASTRVTLEFPPWPPGENTVLASTVQQAVAQLGGPAAELDGSPGAADTAWYAQRGIPAVIYGPGDGLTAHQPDEHVAIEELAFATRVLTLSCVKLLEASARS